LSRSSAFVLAFASLLAVLPASAQIKVTLQPRTAEAFERYAKSVEQELAERWSGKREFLAIDESPDNLAKVMHGDVYIRPGASKTPISIQNGLIHDWAGTIFMPNTTVQKVLQVMQDFDRHSQIYPDVIQSRLISRRGNEVVGEWRLSRKSPFVTVVLNVREQEYYNQAGVGKWICRAYGKDISEVENAGTPDQKVLPPGEGMGFLWLLYGYWTLKATGGGVLVECRTLSLSRDMPSGLAWVIKPFLQTVPRDSLSATLKDTRVAATR